MTLPKDCPVGTPRKRTPKKNLEGTVVRECLKFLHERSDVLYVERRNTGAVQFQDGGFIRFGHKGAADIWCLVWANCYSTGGQIPPSVYHVEIECKRADGKGRQSPDQKEFQAMCEMIGVPYLLVTSVDELAEELKTICS